MNMFKTIITGTGAYIPTEVVSNADFASHCFYADDQVKIETPPAEVVEKFKQITGIAERRYSEAGLKTSDLGTLAARAALDDAGVDPETIDQIIVAHNYGNVCKGGIQADMVPTLATRVKHALGIRNPGCIPYDILFGCPGWVQGVIQADAFFKAGIAKKALVIGTESLSRVIDIYDRDSMIFSDGAGACVLEYKESSADGSGIMASCAVNHADEEAYFIYNGPSYHPEADPSVHYIKMHGRKVYEYAMKQVAPAMKDCLDKAGVHLSEVKKIFIHQANEKMDEAIIKTLFKIYGMKPNPAEIMPMCIHWLGNSSVATVPTLYDLVRRGHLEGHQVQEGDIVLFASVGAGMNINAICYRV